MFLEVNENENEVLSDAGARKLIVIEGNCNMETNVYKHMYSPK